LIQIKHDAWRVACAAFAEALRPPIPVRPSEFARDLIVPDGPRKLGKWDPTLTPYIIEPLDMTSTDSTVNSFCVMKSAQTGFTTLVLAAVTHTICHDKADTMIVQPTDGALSEFNSKKLQPCLEETKATAKRVAKQTSRSASGSTTYEKRFGRYTLTLALASSSADLRSKTIQKAFLDEVDEYPTDLDGQGSPFEMIEARQESFLREGTWKRVKISTPTVKGASAIEAEYEASDKRRWHVKCPHCSHEFCFAFDSHFHFEEKWPFKAHYSCPACGAVLEEHDRAQMVRAGRWIATASAPGRKPGFHFGGLESPFVPWSTIAERYVGAAGDPQKLKGFYNLTLGLPFEMKGDTPSHEILMLRREEGLKRGHIPPNGLILVGSADVQGAGIWYEVLAVARSRQSWVVDAGFIDGATESPDGEAFVQLKERVLDRAWPDAWRRTRKLDAFGCDSGYRAQQVYSWTRANQRFNPMTRGAHVVLALKGGDGWNRPAIGLPSDVDIDFAGRRVRNGAKVRTVGTFSLKAAFMDDLGKEGIKSGKLSDPEGYCHFPDWIDESYFKQLTAEYLDDEMYRGRTKRVWKQRYRDNHMLDCRVYNLALLAYLGFDKLTDDDWAELARQRGAPAGEALELWQAAAQRESSHAAMDAGDEASASAPAQAEVAARDEIATDGWWEDVRRANVETLKRNGAPVGSPWSKRRMR
jgi:phage terminase large subunit GpA-like protein